MNKRPISISIVACVYILTGAIGGAFHLTELKAQPEFPYDIVWVELVSLIAIVAGVYMLRSHNWARWLALAWIAFHVVLSAFRTLPQLAVHGLLCAIFAYFLFRPTATRYFRPPGATAS